MEVRHWNADVNGISLHVAERGPTVLLLHGFPELWLSWRHQMAALAERGFRAIAPISAVTATPTPPTDPAAYSIFHIVALLDHLGLPKVFVVRHDWGALVAWPTPTTQSFAALGDGFYVVQFQEPGRAERAFGRYDVATVLKKFSPLKSTNSLLLLE